MSYVQTHQAADGRHIVQNPETGERFIRTPSHLWGEWLDAWRAEVTRPNPLLDRLFRRAVKRCDWTLYRSAKKAITARRTPAPMPWGHVIFLDCKKPAKAS